MIYAPLVMPEVITGLSMLLLFVAIAIDRGFWTVVIAHTTMAMCFVTVIVQSRLVDFDMNLEEAAMDLGAPPLRTFLTVTLPLIVPAIAAAWMLAFALSLDDLVIASFATGPARHAADPHLFGSASRREAGDQRGVHHLHRGRRRRRAGRFAAGETHRGARNAGALIIAATKESRLIPVISALARRTKQIEQKPDRHDHQRAEQHVRQRPRHPLPRQIPIWSVDKPAACMSSER